MHKEIINNYLRVNVPKMVAWAKDKTLWAKRRAAELDAFETPCGDIGVEVQAVSRLAF
jgi:hypothetical protein